MDGEQESIASVEAEAPNEQAVEPNEPDTEGEQPEGEEVDDDGQDDLEWEGIKVRVPRELKSTLEERLSHFSKGFTTKTQETAALRKELEQGRETLSHQFKASDEEMNARAALISIDGALKSYENVDWDAWEQADLFAAQSGFRKFQELKEQKGQVGQFLDQRQKARTDQTQQETAQRLQATRRYAETEIKGWTPELDSKITDFATKELGFDWNTLKGAYNPQVYRALYLAHIGHAALQKQTQAPKPTAQPAPVPLTKITAKANPPPTGLDDRLPIDEWNKRRREQIARQGR